MAEEGAQAMKATSSSMPHVLMVSFPGQGHIKPLLRLAKRIAAGGLLVTFSTTSEARRMLVAASPAAADSTPTPFGRGFLRFDYFSDEYTFGDPKLDLDDLMINFQTFGPPALRDVLRRQDDAGRPVSCIVNNPFVPWVLDVAAEASIPSAVVWVQSCAVFTTYYYYHHALAEFPTEADPDVTVSLPGLPGLKPEEIATFLLPTTPYKSLRKAILAQFNNIDKASWVFVNSFEELERETIEAISDRVRLIPVGPLVEDEESPPSIRGDMYKASSHCLEWLDAQEPQTVVYVSVGSVVVLSGEEMAELASGLQSSGRPFLWVVRGDQKAVLPEGFIDETKDRGMLVEWSPQDRVLAHRAVACFVTHCGWNSTLEALTAGVPVVAYPQFGDQVTNAKFLVDVYCVGARLRTPAKRDEVVRCLEAVTTGHEAAEIRRKAEEWKGAARGAVAEGGSSERSIQAFVEKIKMRARDGSSNDVGVTTTTTSSRIIDVGHGNKITSEPVTC